MVWSSPTSGLCAMRPCGQDELQMLDREGDAMEPKGTEETKRGPGFAAPKGGSRIDGIACSREWNVQSAEINWATRNVRVPSFSGAGGGEAANECDWFCFAKLGHGALCSRLKS
jgi:hypothetical protein